MITVNFDDIIAMSTAEINQRFNEIDVPVKVQCIDGESIHSGAEIVISHHYWEFLRLYDKLPRLKEYIYTNEQYTGNTHIELMTLFVKDVYEFYNYGDIDSEFVVPNKGIVTIEELGKVVMYVTDILYSNMVNVAMPYTTTFGALDIIQVSKHPKVVEIVNKCKPTSASINRAYGEIKKVLFESPELQNNAFVTSIRTGQANVNQVLQYIGFIGFRTDIDSSILPNPVMASYSRGVHKPADKAKDSRSDAKSQYMNGHLLGDTEYANREVQLVSLIVENIDMDDCGSTHYIKYRVPKLTQSDSRSFYDFVGKYYVDDESGLLKRIRRQDTHLGGKTLRFRTMLTCTNPNPHKLCRCCVGDTSVNITADDGVSFHCTTTVTHVVEQSVISNKHLDASSAITAFIPSEASLKFIRVDNDELSIYLADRLLTGNRAITLKITAKSCPNIADIDLVDDVNLLSNTQLSSIKDIGFVITYRNGMQEAEEIEVSQSGRNSSFSYELLKYMKTRGWLRDERGCIVIDMDEWDATKPILKLPLQHRNKAVFFDELISNIKSYGSAHKQNVADGLNFYESTSRLVMGTYNLTSQEFHFNIALYEGILKPYMAIASDDPNQLDYRLPRIGIDEPTYLDFSKAVGERSASVRQAWQNHSTAPTTLSLYQKEGKPYHPMDSIFADVFHDDYVPD